MVPLAARLQHVDDRVHYLAHVGAARSAAPLRGRNEGFQDRPLVIGQVVGVWFAVHASSLIRQSSLFKWPLRLLSSSANQCWNSEFYPSAPQKAGRVNIDAMCVGLYYAPIQRLSATLLGMLRKKHPMPRDSESGAEGSLQGSFDQSTNSNVTSGKSGDGPSSNVTS